MGEWNVFYIYILGLAGGRYYQKLLSLSLDLHFNFFLFLIAFLLLFSIAIFFPYFLLVRLSLQFVTLFQSRKLVKLVLEELQTDVELQSPMTSQHNGCPHFLVLFLIPFFLKLIVACRLCVIYVRECMIPMYRLWLHGLYWLNGAHYLLFEKGRKNLSPTHSLYKNFIYWYIIHQIK